MRGILTRLVWVARRITETLRLMVGIGNYERYLGHARKYHPELCPLSYAEYVHYCQQKRYASGAGKCC